MKSAPIDTQQTTQKSILQQQQQQQQQYINGQWQHIALQCYYHNWISIIQTGEKEPGSLCIDD
jgi:hypothetical protein